MVVMEYHVSWSLKVKKKIVKNYDYGYLFVVMVMRYASLLLPWIYIFICSKIKTTKTKTHRQQIQRCFGRTKLLSLSRVCVRVFI
jgi:hypothetical protein